MLEWGSNSGPHNCIQARYHCTSKRLAGVDNFSNPQWLAHLALLTSITTHLNDLNVKLQEKNILVTDMYSHITAFEVRLHLWEVQLSAGQFMHFPCIVACTSDDVLVLLPLCGRNLPPVSQVSGHWLQASSCSPSPLTSLWTKPLPPCRWSWWSFSVMTNWKQSTILLLHCLSSVTSSSLLTNFQITLSM